MSYANVQKALDDALALATTLPVALENVSYDPTLEESYVRSTLIPNESIAAFVGNNVGSDLYSGIYQIDIYFPANTGTYALNSEIDAVIEYYNRQNDYLVEGGSCIRIVNAWRETSITEPDWYNGTVSVRWETFN